VKAPKPRTATGVLNLVHMANTVKSLDWAVDTYGANAAEADMEYDGTRPARFYHGGVCDCFCTFGNSICGPLGGCSGSSGVDELLNHVVRKKLALFYFDNKVNDKWSNNDQRQAGEKLAAKVKDSLLDRGFRGRVVIAVPTTKHFNFLKAAKEWLQGNLSGTQFSQVYFAFDMESDFGKALATLKGLGTNQIGYGVGISACWVGNYQDSVRQAVRAKNNGEIAEVFIWTLDKESSIDTYLRLGVTGVLSNKPWNTNLAAAKRGMPLRQFS